jgi:hypothetical protein
MMKEEEREKKRMNVYLEKISIKGQTRKSNRVTIVRERGRQTDVKHKQRKKKAGKKKDNERKKKTEKEKLKLRMGDN